MFNEGQSSSKVIVINPVSAANTAAATSAWIDVRAFEGDILIVAQTGAITGTCTFSIEDATDGSGTGGAAITPTASSLAAVSTANQIRWATVSANECRGWIRLVGTVVTGPVLVSASLASVPKYT